MDPTRNAKTCANGRWFFVVTMTVVEKSMATELREGLSRLVRVRLGRQCRRVVAPLICEQSVGKRELFMVIDRVKSAW